MKKFLFIIIAFLVSIIIAMGYPLIFHHDFNTLANNKNEISIIPQNIIEYTKEKNNYHKIYESGKLIGVINDLDRIDEALLKEYQNYENDFPDSKLGLKDDYYIVDEKSYIIFEDIDDKIIAYLKENDAYGVSATAVEFSTKDGIYDIIYIKNINDFYKARDEFLLNFVSLETVNKLRNNEIIENPKDFGTIETNVKIEENISYKEVIASPDKVFVDSDRIYEYLCYGKNEERQYYIVKEGDTLSGVGYYFGDMSAKQIVMLNKGILISEEQILAPGTKLNVTYYTSPITVSVTRKRLTQEAIAPETPIYREDETIPIGKTEIITPEQFGLKNIMYNEVWINGVLQGSNEELSNVVRDPVQGIIAVGAKYVQTLGTGNFIWPIDNPNITCHFGCYYGHNGTDLQSRSDRYGPIYAADSGTVVAVSFDGISGYYCVIDHNNGYKTYYGHMNTAAYVSVGESVTRGQVIGQIGMTGVASGPHVHFMIYVDDSIVNVCSVMNCSLGG